VAELGQEPVGGALQGGPGDDGGDGHDRRPAGGDRIGDTRHRLVRYWPVAGTRFREYFPADEQVVAARKVPFNCHDPTHLLTEAGFQALGEAVEINVPSSARPPMPRPQYAIPTFRWDPWWQAPGREGESPWRVGRRHGGGLRIYLEGAWYESGEGERLAVILPDPASLGAKAASPPPQLLPCVSRWGLDPTRLPLPWPAAAEHLAGVRAWSFEPSQFRGDFRAHTGLALAEPGSHGSIQRVIAVSYPVHYDRKRGLWYADVEIAPDRGYFPFVRLALARLQPSSLPDLELSAVALADFAQLTPDRTAWVNLRLSDSGEGYTAHVSVVGPWVQSDPALPSMTVSVEEQDARIADPDLGWQRIESRTVEFKPQPTGDGYCLWSGEPVEVPPTTADKRLRLMIIEYETLQTSGGVVYMQGNTALLVSNPIRRVVYAHALRLD